MVSEHDVNVAAHLVSSSPLVYPPVARQAEIEIDFPVEIVVDTDGRVAAARAINRVGYGLEEAALRAIPTMTSRQRAERNLGTLQEATAGDNRALPQLQGAAEGL